MPHKPGDLPGGTEHVPPDARSIYQTTFDVALAKYGDEQKAHASALSAIKRKFIKKGDRWVSRDGEAVMRVLGDKEFSAGEREKLAKKGEAMPSGGFPIANKGDLGRAIKAFGRAKNKAAAKAWIKKRAAALGATEMLPENWDGAIGSWDQLEAIEAADAYAITDAWKKTDPDDDPDEDEDDEKDKKAKDAKSVFCQDGVELIEDAPITYTKDGYLKSMARIARTGIQLYTGDEMGVPDKKIVRVYRPPEEVFNKKSIASLSGLPITIDHPSDFVNKDNWGEHAVGEVGEDVLRDGEFVRVPLILRDGAAIDAFKNKGFQQLSVGYAADISLEDGVTPNGEKYDAVQRRIRGNHLALVPSARGGPLLRVGDNEDHQKGDSKMVKVLIDGQSIDFNDELTAKHVQGHLGKLQQQLVDAKKKSDDDEAEKVQAEEKKTKAETDAATKNGEITALKAQLDAANSKLSGKGFTDAVRAYVDLLAKANAVMEGKVNFDGKEAAEIKRMVVEAKLGDVAKGLSDEEISGAFKVTTADLKPERGTDRLADDLSMLGRGGGTRTDDPKAMRDAAHKKYVDNLSNAWKKPTAAAAR